MVEEVKIIKDYSANPAPLGLLGFGMTTILLNLHNIGLFPMNNMIIAMGLVYGGFAQVIVGLMEWKKGNTFGATAFTSYGFFWLSLIGILVLPNLNVGVSPSKTAMGWYLLLWGILTLFFFIGTFTMSRALQFVFGSLTILFLVLSLSDFTGLTWLTISGGIIGIICGISAFYVAIALVLNEVYNKELFPLGQVNKK